eukprot:TRINITY_DN3027_c0_g1_i3.p1 TRINITY_DN3027_c0_g1~~TRINITY_DN3027_c0_g1_i3.p1  ORF type:complete len:102 (-),score=8.70 TRINITY_DN3027_c0_g1_i3:322-627(-)
MKRNNFVVAIELYEQCLATKDQLGDQHGAAKTLGNLATVAAARGQYDKAVELYEQCLATENELGDEHGAANTLREGSTTRPMRQACASRSSWGISTAPPIP